MRKMREILTEMTFFTKILPENLRINASLFVLIMMKLIK